MSQAREPGPQATFEREFHPELRRPGRTSPFRQVVLQLEAMIRRLARRIELPEGARALDYGCSEMPYWDLFGAGVEMVGADLPGNPVADVEISADGSVPLEDASFDAILSTQVLEHVEDPVAYLAECRRLLRPDGSLLLTTHGIMLYHPDPVDYWRWTWAGLERIVEEAGFEVVRLDGIMGLASTGLQLFQDGVYHRMAGRRRRRLFALLMQALIGFAARHEPRGHPPHNALVFGLIARRR